MMNRRGFLGAALAARAAPAIVRASSIMPIWVPKLALPSLSILPNPFYDEPLCEPWVQAMPSMQSTDPYAAQPGYFLTVERDDGLRHYFDGRQWTQEQRVVLALRRPERHEFNRIYISNEVLS